MRYAPLLFPLLLFAAGAAVAGAVDNAIRLRIEDGRMDDLNGTAGAISRTRSGSRN